MTVSTEGRAGEAGIGAPFGAGWRAEREREQQLALPDGRLVVSCSAPLGAGGLGRHMREIVEAAARNGQEPTCLCAPGGPLAESGLREEGVGEEGMREQGVCEQAVRVDVNRGGRQRVLDALLRRSTPWRMWSASAGFDRAAARLAPEGDHLIAFSSQALLQLRSAERRGVRSLGLVSPTSHLGEVSRRYERAWRRHPFERPWTPRILNRALAEYGLVERIYVSTPYVRDSFLREGFDESRLVLLPLTPDPRFTAPAGEQRRGASFEVLYVGGLSVVKGVPLLVEAFRRLPSRDLRLRLHGGWESRGMRRWLLGACAADERIEICSGDPLASMRSASLYVHPSYEDGFAYSAAEALACGLPVLVSENTGMQTLLEPGRTGAVLPTGDVDALTGAIEAAHRGELLSR
ncbi:MAG TPA: glycosyltransferase family 4 protein [Solirubrobacteraceae bacterium]